MADDEVKVVARAGRRCFHPESDDDGGGDAVTISDSVGQFGKNIPTDVHAVQEALNSLTPQEGQPHPLLKVDGASGPFTIAAIVKFQKLHHCQPDGRVDVGQKTLAALNEVLGSADVGRAGKKKNTPARPLVIPDPSLVAAMVKLVPIVHMAIRASEVACVAADRFITTSPLKQQPPNVTHIARSALAKLESTFTLSKLKNPRPSFENIKRVYRNMTAALNRSFATEPRLAATLFVSNTDKQMDDEAFAYTGIGGAYDGPRVKLKDIGVPANRIYLCNDLADRDHAFQVATLVHELAHYVSGQPIDIDDQIEDGDILDPGDFPRFDRLKPEQKVASADHYALFSMRCINLSKIPAG
jgi:hypothetical protein